MTDPRSVPVVVGVGDLRHGRTGHPEAPIEPLALIADAARNALADSGSATLGEAVDTIYAIRTTSWNYDDLPTLLAERLGLTVTGTHTSTIGGHWPAALLDRLGAEIADGTVTAALLVGGEAQASVKALTKAGTNPATEGWTCAPGGPPAFDPDELGSAEMQRAGLIAPTRVYPLFDNRFGADSGETPAESRVHSAAMYAEFSRVAAAHPASWSPTPRTAVDIATASATNRLVTDVYPLAMNAMPFVDQAAAVVICSLATAREHSVPEARIVYLWGGAGAQDTPDVVARGRLGGSAALENAVDRALSRAGVTGSDLALVDAYSCFPVVPRLLLRALKLPPSTVPSVLGGHSFFGGPLSSYSLHAVARATRELRDLSDGVALVHANGGYLTYQHVVLLSRRPHDDGYVGDPVSQRIHGVDEPVVHDWDGRAEIVTTAVEYDRNGEPAVGLVIARTDDGRRVAGHTDADTAARIVARSAGGTTTLAGTSVQIRDRGGQLTVEFDEKGPRLGP
ncbi:acetyl-CoA acetyltransferase [Actinomycetes bacterium M1A6_2h]